MNWKPLEVTEISTGKRITIKDFKFNPELHKDPKETQVEIVNEPVEEKPFVITHEGRYAFLKNKGWKNLDKQERADYQKLKPLFEPK